MPYSLISDILLCPDQGIKSRDVNENEENLQPFLQRGKQLCQERSILYQTPKSAKKPARLALSSAHSQSKQIVHRRLFSRDSSVNDKEESAHLVSLNDTLGLEITGIHLHLLGQM